MFRASGGAPPRRLVHTHRINSTLQLKVGQSLRWRHSNVWARVTGRRGSLQVWLTAVSLHLYLTRSRLTIYRCKQRSGLTAWMLEGTLVNFPRNTKQDTGFTPAASRCWSPSDGFHLGYKLRRNSTLRKQSVFYLQYPISWAFPGGSVVKTLPANAGDEGLIPGSGRSPGKGHGNPLQYSCLGNPMDKRAWWAIESMGSQELGELVTKWQQQSHFPEIQLKRKTVMW